MIADSKASHDSYVSGEQLNEALRITSALALIEDVKLVI
jgi:biotin operon repressor